MFERENPDPQTDIEFDFFDESPTVEGGERGAEGAPPRRRRKMPTRPPGGSNPSLLRLGLLIAGAILLAAVLVLTVNNCRGNQKKAKYQDYMESVGGPAAESAQVGKDLNDLLTTPGIKLADLRSQLEGLRQQQAQIVANASALDAPGPLREQQQSLVEAMQFRVNGLSGLSAAFGAVQGTPSTAESGDRLAVQAQRLIASDVVWDDSFRDPSKQVLADQGVGDVRVPSSAFVQNPDFYTANGLAAVVTRLRGVSVSPTAGGLHGTNIVMTKALPKGTELSTSTRLPVVAGTDLGFAVTVEDSGDSVEVHIPVTLTITGGTKPIVKNQVIDLISPKEQKTITFRNIQLDPSFFGSQSTSVKVKVNPVPNEHNVSNNSSEYPVIFTLPTQ